MQRLDRHIGNFLQVMTSCGYDGHFLCNSAHPGKLKESLSEHLLETFQGQTHVPPFFLTTYSQWRDDQSPYVKCDFKVKYDHTDGFRAEKMEITHGSSTGKIKSITLPLKGNTDIPYREHANRMVMGSRKKLKIG